MTWLVHHRLPLSAAGLTLALVISGALAHAQPQPQQLPNMGQQITPLAAPDALAPIPLLKSGQPVD